MLRRLRSNRAFTLVELMIVVAIVGLLAALAIYGVRKYMTNAKSAEARNALGQISKGAQTAWDRDLMQGTLVEPGKPTEGTSRRLCPAAAPVPPDAAPVGEKYQSSEADWDTEGWNCLKFSMRGPQYYQYEYTVDEEAKTFAAIARGNLDGDEDESTFTIEGAAVDGTLTVSPAIIEDKPDE